MYEAAVRTAEGEKKDRVWARDLAEARTLLEQRHAPETFLTFPTSSSADGIPETQS